MKYLSIVFSIFMLWIGYPRAAMSDTWPRLKSGSGITQCDEALQFARVTFKSNSFYVFTPPETPNNFGSKLVLGTRALDISGGNALEADQAVFDKLPINRELPIGVEMPVRSIYWQRMAMHGFRLVLQEIPEGWRGDTYALFAVGDKVSSENFLAELQGKSPSSQFIPVARYGLRPPLIFRENQSGQIWFIDVGERFQYLADWQIHVLESGGIKSHCIVQFRPQVTKAVYLLPQPVRELKLLLDQTMGRGENEGTLQPTAGLTRDAEHTWANAALRPWALNEPYNTREEVDAGLKNWSRKGAAYLKAYQKIQRQYLIAEQSLAKFYQRNFHRSATEARHLSIYVMDIAFRSHYTFHSENPDRNYRKYEPQSNPWQDK